MTLHRQTSKKEADRIERQLAAAVLVARKMMGVPLDGYEPTGAFVPDDMRRHVYEGAQ